MASQRTATPGADDECIDVELSAEECFQHSNTTSRYRGTFRLELCYVVMYTVGREDAFKQDQLDFFSHPRRLHIALEN